MQKFRLFAAASLLAGTGIAMSAATGATRIGRSAVEVKFDNAPSMIIDFYGPNIFRVFQDPKAGALRDPEATPPAQILTDNPRKDTGEITVTQNGDVVIATPAVSLTFAKDGQTFSVKDLSTGETVINTLAPAKFTDDATSISFLERPDEYFYGGGVQNGRFSHRGKSIEIRNTNSWTDGGVASPTPYFWSTDGYGVMWYTFAPGVYDFGSTTPGAVDMTHSTPYLDMFVMVSPTPVGLLNDFYQLTGNPVLLPKFGFYEGHLNAYNRDYWAEDEKGILFEDGKKYKESQRDNGGIKESLNGELDGNYQFSARAVIDRYNAYDMPLGWVLPNDGYGAGYGQIGRAHV